LSPEAVSAHLQACDVLLQPYPEGVTTRRTSIMAGLANGRAIVTTSGPLSEPIWAETAAVALEPPADTARLASACRSLLADVDRRSALAARGALLYESSFSLSRTIAILRADAREVPAA
jgi:glycosyltransferase involved in cell wall biosynthesis